MWAGADPRSRGLMLGDEHFGRTEEDRAELAATALMEACYQDNVDVLKRLKPDPSRDNLTELLNCAATLSRKEIIKYLLELGAKPNDKANGASKAMDRCLLHLPHETIDVLIHRRQASRWEVRRSIITGRTSETRSDLAAGRFKADGLYSTSTLRGQP
jgi:ankyrin repeat protein